MGEHGVQEKGPHPYSEQLNIPLVVANHPSVQKGSRSTSLSSNIDIPATILSIAGYPEAFGLSRDLLDLASECPANPRKTNFSEYGDVIKIVEDENYRFAYYPFIGACQLFNKKKDLLEVDNLCRDEGYEKIQVEFFMTLMMMVICFLKKMI